MTYRKLQMADKGAPVEIFIPPTERERRRARGRKVFWLVIFCAIGGYLWGRFEWPALNQPAPAEATVQVEEKAQAPAVQTTALTPLRKLPSPASITLIYVPAKTAIEVLDVAPRGAWLKINYKDQTGWVAGAQTDYRK